MIKVLVHELANEAGPLLERLREVLASVDSPEARSLLGRAAITDHPKPRMVLAGQYSSGKSTLIKALTDGAVDPKIDADIATDEITEYPWHGKVVLVDTPGVQSGLREHDALAWEAIGNSDFILFVVTVNLFDDASAKFLRELANEHQKFDQMIVVITHTSQMSAPEGVRAAAVQDALGTASFTPTICEVDSKYYLRSFEDERRRDSLRNASGIDQLREAINHISANRGELARLRQPLQLIRQLSDEAQELFVDDPHRRMALAVLASQRKALTDRRYFIETQFQGAEARFKSSCQTDIVGFVDTASAVDQQTDTTTIPAAWAQLLEALGRHADKFADEVNILTAQQFATLTTQLGEIDDSNRVAELVRFTGAIALKAPSGAPQAGSAGPQAAQSSDADPVSWARQVGAWLRDGRSLWGAGDGVKAASGSFGHQAVKDVGHLFGAKFKPWQAARIADRIGKAAKFAGFAIQIGTSVVDVFASERSAIEAQQAAERRRSAFVTDLMSMADSISSDARSQLSEAIDPVLKEVLDHIDRVRGEIISQSEARTTHAAELRSIASKADQLLALGAGPTIIDITQPGSE